jgi:predicted DNA-binding transcriptional regulator YafY
MTEQAKIQRLLRLLMLLAGKRRYSAAAIEEKLGILPRTLYRYLDSLEQAGFVVERQTGQGYRLAPEAPATRRMQALLHFTEAEALLLYRTLQSLQGDGPAKDRLLRKLHTLYDCHILAQPHQQHTLHMVATLRQAMQQGLQCTLLQYRSNQSQTIRNRQVEPFAFTENYEGIWCYEPDAAACRQFKLARMEGIALTGIPYQYSTHHLLPFTDAFGFAATVPLGTAHLQLSLKAANLLREEYPLSEKYLQGPTTDGHYTAQLPYASHLGIGRFVLGLYREIRILGPDTLQAYLAAEISYMYDTFKR